MQNSSGMGELAGPDQLTLNMLLPNSVILWIAAVLVFIRSVLRNNRFLRNFSIVINIIMLVKLFAIDFGSLGAGERTSVFLVLGLFLIGFAFVYPKLLKNEGAMRRRGEGAMRRGEGK